MANKDGLIPKLLMGVACLTSLGALGLGVAFIMWLITDVYFPWYVMLAIFSGLSLLLGSLILLSEESNKPANIVDLSIKWVVLGLLGVIIAFIKWTTIWNVNYSWYAWLAIYSGLACITGGFVLYMLALIDETLTSKGK